MPVIAICSRFRRCRLKSQGSFTLKKLNPFIYVLIFLFNVIFMFLSQFWGR